jgi:hypothetical protein
MSASDSSGKECFTDNSEAILFVFEGPGNTTRRPWPPDLPRYWPGRTPPEEPPAQEEPPSNSPEKS